MSVRVVFETNIVASALLFTSGRLSWLREAWASAGVVPLASRETVDELLRVLHYPKFELEKDDRHELLGDYLPFVEVIELPAATPTVPPCKDPDDRKFLQLALVGNADLLVTGDADLLALSATFPVPIVSPTQAESRLRR